MLTHVQDRVSMLISQRACSDCLIGGELTLIWIFKRSLIRIFNGKGRVEALYSMLLSANINQCL